MEARRAHQIGFWAGTWPLDPAKPTLVLIHSSGATREVWRGQIDALTDCANTIALDLPGRGRSGGEGLCSIPEYTRVVADFVEEVGAPRPVPCGVSLGGGITQQLLLDYSERFSAGILIGTGARLRVTPVILEGILLDYDAYLSNMAAVLISQRSDPRLLDAVTAEMAQCPPAVTHGDFAACDAFDVMDRLSQIRAPVLIMSGEDDYLTPPKYARYLEEHIENAQRAHFEGIGHLSPLERPAEVNQVIRAFLARCCPAGPPRAI